MYNWLRILPLGWGEACYTRSRYIILKDRETSCPRSVVVNMIRAALFAIKASWIGEVIVLVSFA